MDCGWSKDPYSVEDPAPNGDVLIRSRRIGPITVGTVERFMQPHMAGFWFLSISGTKIHLSGKW